MRCHLATQLSDGSIIAIIPSYNKLVHSATLSADPLIYSPRPLHQLHLLFQFSHEIRGKTDLENIFAIRTSLR